MFFWQEEIERGGAKEEGRGDRKAERGCPPG